MEADKSNLRNAAAWKIDIVGYTKNNERIKNEMRNALFPCLYNAISDVNKILLNEEISLSEKELIDNNENYELIEIYKEVHIIIKEELDNFYSALEKRVGEKEKEKTRSTFHDGVKARVSELIAAEDEKNPIIDKSRHVAIVNHIDKFFRNIYEKELDLEETGDGGDIVVANTLAHHLLLLSEKVSTDLRERDLSIKVRMGMHVDLGFQEKDKKRIAGGVRDYLERITYFGSDGDILLTEQAVITITAITDSFDNDLYYAGTYPIKHGQYLKVWYYNNQNAGNFKRPKVKDTPLIKNLSKRNKIMAISIITIACLGSIISGILFFNQLSLSIKVETFKADLQNEMFNIYQQHQDRSEVVKRLFQSKLNRTGNGFNPKLGNLMDNNVLLNINSFLQNNVGTKNANIQYGWIARTINEKCTIVAYKPYDATFINRTDYSDFPWCKGIQKFDYYTSESYYASGPRDFVNTIVSKITVDRPDGKSITIGYYGEALNWNNIIPPLMKYVNKDNAILVDHKGYLSADCKIDGCRKLSIDPSTGNIKNESQKYMSNDFINEMFAGKIGGEYDKDSPYNSQLLNNWKVYLLSDNERVDIIIHLGLFIVTMVLVAVTIYYYLIPRYWLDDIRK